MLDRVVEQMGKAIAPQVRETKHKLKAPRLSLSQAEPGELGYNPTEALAIGMALHLKGPALEIFTKTAQSDYMGKGNWLSGDALKPYIHYRAMQEDILEAAIAAVQYSRSSPVLTHPPEDEKKERGAPPPPTVTKLTSQPRPPVPKPPSQPRELIQTLPPPPAKAPPPANAPPARTPHSPHIVKSEPAREANWPYDAGLPKRLGLLILKEAYDKVLVSGGVRGDAEIAVRQIEINYTLPPMSDAAALLRSGKYDEFERLLAHIDPPYVQPRSPAPATDVLPPRAKPRVPAVQEPQPATVIPAIVPAAKIPAVPVVKSPPKPAIKTPPPHQPAPPKMEPAARPAPTPGFPERMPPPASATAAAIVDWALAEHARAILLPDLPEQKKALDTLAFTTYTRLIAASKLGIKPLGRLLEGKMSMGALFQNAKKAQGEGEKTLEYDTLVRGADALAAIILSGDEARQGKAANIMMGLPWTAPATFDERVAYAARMKQTTQEFMDSFRFQERAEIERA